PSPKPSPSPTPEQIAAKTTPAPGATVAATPRVAAPAPARTTAVRTVAANGDTQAAAVVRSYLEALARGDSAAAGAYLAHGTPNESFMKAGAHIESISSANVGPQQYRVGADVQTSVGEYYVTFTVERGPSGLQITDHYTTKPE
ncbi:MAG: hypothetical protein JO104_11045, partial [Candidatus Eremiobacteraeota bacterium]|nr:hypothetical protein [Candidatus Eremiobacteraeota bacterium]